MSIQEELARNVYAYRMTKGLTQADIAERIGISPASISRKLSGSRDWKLGEFEAICEEMGMDYDEALGNRKDK